MKLSKELDIPMKSEEVLDSLSALAQETRLNIFRVLVKAHSPEPTDEGMAAGELSLELDIAAPTLSFHLKEMSRAGLIYSRKEGRSIIYKANIDQMKSLISYLLEDCCMGLCGINR